MTERSSVQNPMLRYAEQIGWQYINPPEALSQRGDETGLYFSDILISQLQTLNPGVVDSSRASEVLRKLNLLWPSIEGNRDASLGYVASSSFRTTKGFRAGALVEA